MSQQSSPFLQRDSKQNWHSWVAWDDWRRGIPIPGHGERLRYHERELTYAERIIPSEYSQKLKIETYRYRWYQRNGTLGQFLQHIGDFGRRHIVWLFIVPTLIWFFARLR